MHSMATAYGMKKKRRMAHGGEHERGPDGICMAHGAQCMAEGGEVDYPEGVHGTWDPSKPKGGNSYAGDEYRGSRMAAERGQPKAAAHRLESSKREHHKVLGEIREGQSHDRRYLAEGGEVEDDDLVSRIMHKRGGYSEGGRVANEEKVLADFEPNEFDDLALRDDLEQHDTGANSGDELGDEAVEEDERDLVARIMRSRGKKDRNPRPA